jgi:hypothetical protein
VMHSPIGRLGQRKCDQVLGPDWARNYSYISQPLRKLLRNFIRGISSSIILHACRFLTKEQLDVASSRTALQEVFQFPRSLASSQRVGVLQSQRPFPAIVRDVGRAADAGCGS